MAQEVTNNNANETKVKKVLSIVLNCLFYIFILILLIFSISNLLGKDENVPKLFGNYYLAVKSNSMDGDKEDSFKAGDLIVDKVITDELLSELEIGDIITFVDLSIDAEGNGGNQFNTHRIVEIIKDENGKVLYYVTRGDLSLKTLPDLTYDKDNYSSSQVQQQNFQQVYTSSIKGVYKNQIKNAGNVLFYLRSETGFALCIILPTIILLGLEVFFLIRNVMAVNKEKLEIQMAETKEQNLKDLELERERMKQELLAEIEKEKENKTE